MGANPWRGRKNQACRLQPCLVLRRMKAGLNPSIQQQQQQAAAAKQQAACGKLQQQQRQPLGRKSL
jgi:hypothetical protein